MFLFLQRSLPLCAGRSCCVFLFLQRSLPLCAGRSCCACFCSFSVPYLSAQGGAAVRVSVPSAFLTSLRRAELLCVSLPSAFLTSLRRAELLCVSVPSAFLCAGRSCCVFLFLQRSLPLCTAQPTSETYSALQF